LKDPLPADQNGSDHGEGKLKAGCEKLLSVECENQDGGAGETVERRHRTFKKIPPNKKAAMVAARTLETCSPVIAEIENKVGMIAAAATFRGKRRSEVTIQRSCAMMPTCRPATANRCSVPVC